jgi:hypothetical protein
MYNTAPHAVDCTDGARKLADRRAGKLGRTFAVLILLLK